MSKERHGGTTEGCSQSDWQCGLPKQKYLCFTAAIQDGQLITSYAQVSLSGRKNVEEKLQQNVYINYKLDESVYLVDVMNSVYDKVIANQPICIVFLKSNCN